MMSRHSTYGRGDTGDNQHHGAPPASTQHPGTHGAILEPLLEAVPARCRLCHVAAALRQDPPHQDLLQLGVVLAVDLLLHLPAQPVRWSPVCHGDSGEGGVCRDRTPPRQPHRWHRVMVTTHGWVSVMERYRPCQALPASCSVPTPWCSGCGSCSEHPSARLSPAGLARTGQSLFEELPRLLGPGATSGTGTGSMGPADPDLCRGATGAGATSGSHHLPHPIPHPAVRGVPECRMGARSVSASPGAQPAATTWGGPGSIWTPSRIRFRGP